MSTNEDYRDKKDFESKLLESYDDIRQINSGGGGIIYEATHKRLNQKVILKRIRSDKISIIGSRREIEILKNLKHRYLPRILDFWSYGDEVYTIMEFIEGKSFKELLDEGMIFREKDVIRWTRQLIEVMEYLHNSPGHVIHSDIKPANLMLTPQNDICLIDFNVSLLQGGEADESIGYSVGYSPVEQLLALEEQRQKRKIEKSLPRRQSASDTVVLTFSAQNVNIPASRESDEATELDTDSDDATQIDDRTQIDDATQIDDTVANNIKTNHIQADGTIQMRTRQTYTSQTHAIRTQSTVPRTMDEALPELTRQYGTKLKVDERSDIYSACATMYHILTGRHPLPCYEKQIPIEDLMPEANDAFADILMHGLEQNPKKRFKDSTQMLNALEQLAKSTRVYKRLRLKQDFALLLLLICFLGSAGAAYVGWGMRNEEELTVRMADAMEYYGNRQYQEAIEYLDSNILNNILYQKSSQLSQGYYISGNCNLEMGNYLEAIDDYRRAILLDGTQPSYYRDYGIALARSGNLELARENLEQARARGLDSSGSLLLQGEIAALEGNYTQAESYLWESIESSEDITVKMRSYVKLDQVLEEGFGESAYPDRIQILEEASETLPNERKLLILERLIQVYGNYGQLTGEETYTLKAIDTLQEVIDLGYGTLVEWLNQAVYYQSIARYSAAKQCLWDASEIYLNNYLIYKRLAFLEIEIQGVKEAGDRDYQEFKQYFDICDELYQSAGLSREQDLEMEYLYQVYDEIVVMGWLSE